MASPRASIGQLAEAYMYAHGRKIGEVMTCNVLTVTEDPPLEQAVRLIQRNRVKRLRIVKVCGRMEPRVPSTSIGV